MAWSNRTSLPVLLQRFPSLHASGAKGEMAGWCPCQHPENVLVRFTALEHPEGWAVDYCDFGHLPSEIWAASDRLREPGEDDGKKPGFEQFVLVDDHRSVQAEPPQREYLLRSAMTGAGVLARGQVGLLASRGGTGKSNAIMQLGCAVCVGGTWFGSPYGWTCIRGRALLLFAEEDAAEVRRRRYYAMKAMGITSEEDLELVSKNLILAPMRGLGSLLSGPMQGGVLPITHRAVQLSEFLQHEADRGEPFALVGLDPLSRLAGDDIEGHRANTAITRFIEITEVLTLAKYGSPNVIITAHNKKFSIADKEMSDSADAVRGPTGLVDAARWCAVMDKKRKASVTTLRVAKTNYAVEPEPLYLESVSGCGGMLHAIEKPEATKGNGVSAPDVGLMNRLHDEIEAHGPDSGRHLARRIHANDHAVGHALDDMLSAGRVVKQGAWKYALPPEPVPETCAEPELNLSPAQEPSANNPEPDPPLSLKREGNGHRFGEGAVHGRSEEPEPEDDEE